MAEARPPQALMIRPQKISGFSSGGDRPNSAPHSMRSVPNHCELAGSDLKARPSPARHSDRFCLRKTLRLLRCTRPDKAARARQAADRNCAASTKNGAPPFVVACPKEPHLPSASTAVLQTLRNAAVGTHARSSGPALILLADVDTSFDFQFNDYLHPASLCAAPITAQLLAAHTPRSLGDLSNPPS